MNTLNIIEQKSEVVIALLEGNARFHKIPYLSYYTPEILDKINTEMTYLLNYVENTLMDSLNYNELEEDYQAYIHANIESIHRIKLAQVSARLLNLTNDIKYYVDRFSMPYRWYSVKRQWEDIYSILNKYHNDGNVDYYLTDTIDKVEEKFNTYISDNTNRTIHIHQDIFNLFTSEYCCHDIIIPFLETKLLSENDMEVYKSVNFLKFHCSYSSLPTMLYAYKTTNNQKIQKYLLDGMSSLLDLHGGILNHIKPNTFPNVYEVIINSIDWN